MNKHSVATSVDHNQWRQLNYFCSLRFWKYRPIQTSMRGRGFETRCIQRSIYVLIFGHIWYFASRTESKHVPPECTVLSNHFSSYISHSTTSEMAPSGVVSSRPLRSCVLANMLFARLFQNYSARQQLHATANAMHNARNRKCKSFPWFAFWDYGQNHFNACTHIPSNQVILCSHASGVICLSVYKKWIYLKSIFTDKYRWTLGKRNHMARTHWFI